MLIIIGILLLLILAAILGGENAVAKVVLLGIVAIVVAFIIFAQAVNADEINPCAGKPPIEIVRCQGHYPAAKFIVIENNDGGNVLSFSGWFATLYKSGIPVHIRGTCASACTMILALGDQACLESGAKLGFHAASVSDKFSKTATEFLADGYYPPNIQKWFYGMLAARIKSHQPLDDIAWLTDRELVASGTMKPCI